VRPVPVFSNLHLGNHSDVPYSEEKRETNTRPASAFMRRWNQVTTHQRFHDVALPSRSKATRQRLSVFVNREEDDLLAYCRAY
jgi:hypothetical protein